MNNRVSKWYCVVWLITGVVIASLLVLAAPVAAAATMTVVSKTPTVNQLAVVADSNIVVTFSENINNATVNANTFKVNSPLKGLIAGAYSTNGAIVTFNPTTNFKAGEIVTITLTSGIQSVPGNTLTSPVTWQFTAAVSGGYATFPYKINFGSGLDHCFSLALGDVDSDGDLDIVMGNQNQQNVVYKNNGTGTAWTPVNFGTGSDNTLAVALGDVDGDGDLDIVVGNQNQQNVVYKNDGTGTTWTGVNFGTGSNNTITLALGDIDGDGDLDIVEGNNGTPSVVYKNNGNGTLWTGVNFGIGDNVALGDVDGDGDLDIVVAHDQHDVVYKNDGTGTTWTSVSFGTGSDIPLAMALGDVDGDGDLDIISGDILGQNMIYKNDGTGSVWAGTYFGTGDDDTHAFAVGDLDGDGALDIVVGNADGKPNVVYRNNGSGSIWTGINFETGNNITRFALGLGDVDNDGDLDLIAGGCGAQSVVFINGPNPEIKVEGNSIEIVSGDATPSVSDHTDFGSPAVAGGTLDRTYTIKNTGTPGLNLTGNPRVSVSGTNFGDFSVITQPSSPIPPGGSTTFIVRFDPSAPGLRTATVSIPSDDYDENVYTYAIQGIGSGGLNIATKTPVANRLATADSNIVVTFSDNINNATVSANTFTVNGSLSGRIAGAYSTSDAIVTFNPTTNFKVGETVTVTLTTGIQNSSGNTLTFPVTWQFIVAVSGNYATFLSGVNFGTGSDNTYSLALGDIDGNGSLDIVVGNDGGQNVIYQNDGTGTTWTSVNFGTGSDNTRSVALGDVDGDGDLDIIVGNYIQQNVVYKNDGSGTTWTGVNFGTGSDNTRSVALGDVDGDGDLDIIVGNYIQQNVVYKNDGSGTTWTPVNFGAGTNSTYSVALGDLDGDGDLDIVEGNYGNPNVIYRNNGIGTGWTTFVFDTGTYFTTSIVLGDVDNNGSLDIVAGCSDRQNMMYLNDGTGTTWNGEVAWCGSGHDSTRSVALGDIGGDGDLDVVEGNDGYQSMFYLNNGPTAWNNVRFGFGPVDSKTYSLALGDVDSDGNLDIVAGNYSQQNVVYKNSPNPEIRVEGNSTEIVNGDVTPSVSDHTDFGSVAVAGSTVEKTYTIKNLGAGVLTLFGPPKIRQNYYQFADFSITSEPLLTIPAGGSTTFTVRFDPSASGLRKAMVDILNSDADEDYYSFAIQGLGSSSTINFSPAGKIAFASEREGLNESKIYMMGAIGSSQTKLTGPIVINNTAARDWAPSCSPDGTKVAFYSTRDMNAEIYTVDMAGNLTRLTTDTHNDAWPAWSPDGSKIAFVSNRDGNWEIYIMGTDGSNQSRLTNNTANDLNPRWLPDGRIAFNSDRDGTFKPYVMNANGSNWQIFTGPDGVWSPDGSKIAFVSSIVGNSEIYVSGLDGSNQKKLTNNPANDLSPVWSPDSNYIAFTSDRDGNYEIYVITADGSTLVRLTNDSAQDSAPSWTVGNWPINPPSSGGGGGGGGGTLGKIITPGLTSASTLYISSTGVVSANSQLTTSDGLLTLDIAKDTKMLTKENNAVAIFSADIIPSPPPPPSRNALIVAYNFGPEGAIFDPPLTITISYNPDTLPQNVSEKTLYIAYYDGNQWQSLESIVDTAKRTVTAKISHFSSYAMIAQIKPPTPAVFTVANLAVSPSEVTQGETVTVKARITNTGGSDGTHVLELLVNDTKETSQEISIAAGSTKDFSFQISRKEAGTYTITAAGLEGKFTVKTPEPIPTTPTSAISPEVAAQPTVTPPPATSPSVEPVSTPAASINWWLVGGLIAAVIVAGSGILVISRRRKTTL